MMSKPIAITVCAAVCIALPVYGSSTIKASTDEAPTAQQNAPPVSQTETAVAPESAEVRVTQTPPGEDPISIRRRIAAAEAALAGEPSLIALLEAALREADAGRTETGRWKRGVRVSALLPTLKVSGDYGAGRDEALDRYQDKPDRWGADTDRGFGIDVSLQWKLDRLVFNTDELKVYDSLADRASRRESLSAYLIGLYFERRRLQLEEMLLPQTDVGEVLDRRLRIEELGRTIDALTGGLLSSKLSGSRKTRP